MDFNVPCYLFYEYSVKFELILKEESRMIDSTVWKTIITK